MTKRLINNSNGNFEESKETKNSLINKEMQGLHQAFNSIEDILLIIDRDYNIENINKFGLSLFKKSREDIIGKKCYSVFHDFDEPCSQCPFKITLKTTISSSIERFEKALGRYFSIKTTPIFDNNGNVVKFAELLYDITDRKKMEDKLRKTQDELLLKTNNLEETNNALNKLLGYLEESKNTINDNIQKNMESLILPYLERLNEVSDDSAKETIINIVKRNLSEIVKPFTNKLLDKTVNLSPALIKVADLIKEGKTAEDIAKILNISENTVKTHKRKIRLKLGIHKKNINLKAYLQSISE